MNSAYLSDALIDLEPRLGTYLEYHRNTYHNTLISWRHDWTPRLHYVNIATPAEWTDATVTCIDLDLDVYRIAGTDTVVVDDEDEFETHRVLYEYPDDLVARCIAEVVTVGSLMQERRGLFSDRVFRWRPGDQVSGEFTGCDNKSG